ncbi:hypothetical protein [Desulfonatronospira sp. MSAO_Bac3]|uniref:hypothetical protein n=1 Tax=Desulfonatronospira sp. MSAO_Bac3 TaxID=2293857 RepID=UPI000FF12148|nr:hypothetical protein [Desulfonatronospira sp. MSAO_Bac3]RQD74900.1 MAG: hypothetical protein D5S03_09420 [Desulfonatronospira sp. MSAO_Bac3]
MKLSKFNRIAAASQENTAEWAQWIQPDYSEFSFQSVLINIVAILFMIAAVAGMVWLIEMAVGWLGWLFWPIVFILGMLALLIYVTVLNLIRLQFKRWDTGTQNIRSASQGRIELVGRCQAPVEPLVSPLFGVPCAYCKSTLTMQPSLTGEAEADSDVSVSENGQNRQDPASPNSDESMPNRQGQTSWRDQKSLDSFLLCDDGYQVFAPILDDIMSNEMGIGLSGKPPESYLSKDVKEYMRRNNTEMVSCYEWVVPVGRLLQANAVFKTMMSDGDYVEELLKRQGLENSEFNRESLKKIEKAWSRYAETQEAAGGGEPVKLDTLLPLSIFKGVAVTARPYNLFYFIQGITVLLVLAVTLSYFILTWFGVVPTLPFLDFGLEKY